MGVEKFSRFPIQLGGMGIKMDWKHGFAMRAHMRSAASYVIFDSSSLLGTWRSWAQVQLFVGTNIVCPLKRLQRGPLILSMMSGA